MWTALGHLQLLSLGAWGVSSKRILFTTERFIDVFLSGIILRNAELPIPVPIGHVDLAVSFQGYLATQVLYTALYIFCNCAAFLQCIQGNHGCKDSFTILRSAGKAVYPRGDWNESWSDLSGLSKQWISSCPVNHLLLWGKLSPTLQMRLYLLHCDTCWRISGLHWNHWRY